MTLSAFKKYGNAFVILKNMITSGIVPHAFLIEGDRSTDKIGFAEAFAQALLCPDKPGEGCGICRTCRRIQNGNYSDFHMVAPVAAKGSGSGVQSIRDEQILALQRRFMQVPAEGDRNVAVIDEAETMTIRAQTRILKTLEEPDPGTVIMILTDNSEDLLPTIRSRCTRIRLVNTEYANTEDEITASAEILRMIFEHRYFFEIKGKLEEVLKNRQDALTLLDGVEWELGALLRKSIQTDEPMNRETVTQAIKFTEQAREDIRRNVSFRYVFRSLVLRFKELFA